MALLDAELVERAKQMDLLTYLRIYEPEELVLYSGDTYTTRTHDSLKISNGKWMWWSRGIGGYDALSYLVKVKEMPFRKAVELLLGAPVSIQRGSLQTKEAKPKQLLLPEASPSAERAIWYLHSRGIDMEIIQDCLSKGLIYESLPYHNVIFVGLDADRTPRYAAYRATCGKRLMGDASGSDKHHSFRMMGREKDTIHLFECAIDALSYATLAKLNGENWRRLNLISLAGVYAPKAKVEESKTPVAVLTALEERPEARRIVLHLDNDHAGRLATKALQCRLGGDYQVIDAPPPRGKDMNDFLCDRLHIGRSREGSLCR